MDEKWKRNTIITFIGFVLLTRIALPPFFSHPVNFSGLNALALFCGAYFHHRLKAIAVICMSVCVSDLLINTFTTSWVLFYPGWYWQYLSYALISSLGFYLLKKPSHLLPTCFLSSLLFFVVTNFGVWWSSNLYSPDLNGLIICYGAAIPFFKNTACADLVFSIVLFGSFYCITKRSFLIRPQ